MSIYHSLQWAATADQYPLSVKPVVTHTDQKLSWHQPAVMVWDDFLQSSPLRLKQNTLLPIAEQQMSASFHRYACVMDSKEVLVGLLSKADIHGRKSIALAAQRQSSWAELSVGDLMIPVSHLPQVSKTAFMQARIGDAAATLQQANAEYLLVHGLDDSHADSVCGVVSRLGIIAHTGESVRLYHRASSFSEIVDAL